MGSLAHHVVLLLRIIVKVGVRFCGGCNPRFERGEAYKEIKSRLENVDFQLAEEGAYYDTILVIGGCSACCASYEQFDYKYEEVKMWDSSHIEEVVEKLKHIENL